LSIDVEGVDFKVLKSLDLKRYHPEIICIECWESSRGIGAVLDSEIYQYLIKQGYELKAWLGLSTIFVRSFR
jgi:hypothetical protein